MIKVPKAGLVVKRLDGHHHFGIIIYCDCQSWAHHASGSWIHNPGTSLLSVILACKKGSMQLGICKLGSCRNASKVATDKMQTYFQMKKIIVYI